jgi:hypothetical protein
MNKALMGGFAALFLMLSGCAFEPATPLDSGGYYMQNARADFDARFEACKKIHGYDPDKLSVAEHQLAPNERKARSCVYEAIQSLLIPNTKIPEKYEKLILTDKILTDSVEKGIVTRDQRKRKIEELLAEIESLEAGHVVAQDQRGQMQAEQNRTEFTRKMIQMVR